MSNLKNLIKADVGEQPVSDDINPTELAIGVQTEMEHTNDLKIAKEIALDHLSHDPEYYSKLAKAGLSRDFDCKASSGYGDPDSGFNDVSRIGNNDLNNTNMGGTIGNTSDGQVFGRRSEPVHNKTIDIKLNEKKKKSPKPKNPKLWAKAISLAKSKFDVWPSAYASGWAAKWYKGEGGKWKMSENDNLEENFKKSVNLKINHNIMKKSRLKNEIKKIVRDSFLKENDDIEISDEETSETVTITLDKALAQSLHDVLMAALQPSDEETEGDEGLEVTADETDELGGSEESELTPVDNIGVSDEESEADSISEAKRIVSNLKNRKS